MKKTAALITVILLLSGCAKDPQQAASDRATQQAQLQAQQNRLDANKPLTANTHFAAGQLAESEGDFGRAIDQYNQALKIDPMNQMSLYRLGMIYAMEKQYGPAIDVWQQYVKATKSSATGYSNLAFCQELAGRTRDAEASYKAGVAREPNNQPCRVNYGLMLARQGRVDEAMGQLQAVLTPAEAHYDVASVLEAQGKTDQAKAQYIEALKINPDMDDAKTRLAGLE